MRYPYVPGSRRVLGWVLIAAAGFAIAPQGRCAEVSVDASVDRTSLTTAETLTLTINVTVIGSGALPQPRIPDLAAFAIVSSSTGRTISIDVSGGSSTETHQYILQPTQTGRLTIGAVTIQYGGNTYRTKPITITVTRGAAPPSAPPTPQPAPPRSPSVPIPAQPRPAQTGEPVFVQANVDKRTAYVNEQITWTFLLFQASRGVDVGGYHSPTTTGFWTEDLPPSAPTQRVIGNRQYVVEQIRMALFPAGPGKLTIGPASVTCSHGFFGPARQLSTDPIGVNVLPLPSKGRPSGFQGTVGQWRLSGSVDRTRAPVGDALTYAVRVTGTGNVHAVARPTVRGPAGVKVYESAAQRHTDRSTKIIKGEARFEYIVIGMRAGDYEIGPAELPYFDPKARAYRLARNQPLHASFVKGSGTAISVAPGARDEARTAALREALRDLKPAGDDGVAWGAPFYARGTFWALQAVPLLAIVLGVVYGRRQRRLATDQPYARRTRAAKRAHQALTRLRQGVESDSGSDFYTELHEAVSRYITDKLNVSSTAVAPGSIGELLQQAGAGEAAAAKAVECLRRCEFGRFAPTETTRGQRTEDLEQAIALLSKLEWERLADG